MTEQTQSAQPLLRVGRWRVFPDRRLLDDGVKQLELEPRVMQLLMFLAQRPGRVIPSEQLLIQVWGGSFYGDAPVQRAIALLRRALGDSAAKPSYIETIRKRGYRLIAPVVHTEAYARALVEQPMQWRGRNPYKGLRPFASGDAAVFFGRRQATAALLERIKAQASQGRAFTLVVGPSGCGKTSVINAGVIPPLARPDGFDGMRALDVARVDLADTADYDPIDALCDALRAVRFEGSVPFPGLRRSALLTPDAGGDVVRALEANLLSVGQRRSEGMRPCLLLVIDHAERLVNALGARTDAAASFVRIIDALVSSPCASVVMLARNDLYPILLAAIPQLAEWKQPQGHFDLLPPNAGEISEIIRGPAAIAGVTFGREPKTWRGLDEVLQGEVVGHANPLPLLQFVLAALYERLTPEGELSVQAYRQIGGLRGAIAARADDALRNIPKPQSEAALARLLSALVASSADGRSQTARFVGWQDLDDAQVRELARRLVDARLLVSDLIGGRQQVGLAHEALLEAWPLAVDWLERNRHWLGVRARLREAATRWQGHGRHPDLLLQASLPRQEAQQMCDATGWRLDDVEAELLAASWGVARRRRIFRVGALLALGGLIAILAWTFRSERKVRDELARQQDSSTKLAEVLVGDLPDRLRPLGRLDLLDSVSSAVLEAGPGEQTDCALDPASGLQHARALRTQAEVFVGRGRPPDAIRVLHEAWTCINAVRGKDVAATQDVVLERGTIAFWLGNVAFMEKRYEDAGRYFRQYDDATRRLLESDPENPGWMLERSYAWNNQGSLAYATGDFDGASNAFLQSVALKRRVLQRQPQSDVTRAELADSYAWLSSVQQKQRDFGAALASSTRQISILSNLVGAEPDKILWVYRRGVAVLLAAELNGALDDDAAAAAHLSQAIDDLRAATAADPTNLQWLRTLAYAHIGSARLQIDLGRFSEAQRALDAAAHVLPGPVDPETAPIAVVAASVLLEACAAELAFRSAESPLSARQRVGDALVAMQRLQARDPHSVQAMVGLLRAARVEGELVALQGDARRAARIWRQAIDAVTAAGSPAELDWRLEAPLSALRERLLPVS